MIRTLDNPGWHVRMRANADLEAFDRVAWEDGDEWLHAWLDEGQLNVACGPRSLGRALTLLRETLEPSA